MTPYSSSSCRPDFLDRNVLTARGSVLQCSGLCLLASKPSAFAGEIKAALRAPTCGHLSHMKNILLANIVEQITARLALDRAIAEQFIKWPLAQKNMLRGLANSHFHKSPVPLPYIPPSTDAHRCGIA